MPRVIWKQLSSLLLLLLIMAMMPAPAAAEQSFARGNAQGGFQAGAADDGDDDHGAVDQFVVNASDFAAGVRADYSITFSVSCKSFRKLDKGGVTFDFPSQFSLAQFDSVRLSDDLDSRDYGIRSIDVSGSSLTLHLKATDRDDDPDGDDNDDDDDEPKTVVVQVLIAGVVNSPLAGQYRLSLSGFNKKDKTIFGPAESEPFLILPTELPNELASLNLSISRSQLVGIPLLSTALLRLLDADGNPLVDYDLAANPVLLSTGSGMLEPSELNDNGLLENGVIDLGAAGVRFDGHSAITEVSATSNDIISNSVEVSFSGFDILVLRDQGGHSIRTLIAGSDTAAELWTVNRGELDPVEPIRATITWQSTGETIVIDSSTISPWGYVVLPVDLHIPDVSQDEDTLTVNLTSVFEIDGQRHTLVDHQVMPLSIVRPGSISPVPDSFSPDTVYIGVPFSMGFSVIHSAPIDRSGRAGVKVTFESGDEQEIVFDSPANYSSVDSNLMTYRDIPGLVGTNSSLSPGTYHVSLSYRWYSNHQLIGFFDTTIGTVELLEQPGPTLAAVQIVSVDIVAPNAPKVNNRQEFTIRALVANRSDQVSALQVTLASDGGSQFVATQRLGPLAAFDTVEVNFPVTATDRPIHSELFTVSISPLPVVDVLPPIDDTALATIQRPAFLELTYILAGVGRGTVRRGEQFSISVALINRGEADVSDARFRFNTGGPDFGTNEVIEGPLAVGVPIVFDFRAPDFDTTAWFSFVITDTSNDLNTDQSALIGRDGFRVRIRVVPPGATGFNVKAILIDSSVIAQGRPQELFALQFNNSHDYAVELNSLFIGIDLPDGATLSMDSLFDPERTGFSGRDLMSSLTAQDSGLFLDFARALLPARSTLGLVFTATVRSSAVSSFGLQLRAESINATFASGPNWGERVPVVPSNGDSLLFSREYTLHGSSFQQSFGIENNPFNPLLGPARFSFVLSQSSNIEFRIFTATGQLVYEQRLSRQAMVGQDQFFTWDGRNGDGEMVHNGVYIATLTTPETNQTVRKKIMVLK
ncbi:MAG: FlgD immunoglobulin-like domain containing protein [Candidatus Zixiibacteriota bacterium]